MPRILVSPDCTRLDHSVAEQVRLDLRYLYVLEEAGAAPIIASPISDLEHLAHLCDGWLITGGDDLPEELLGEPLHPEARVAHPLRIATERVLYRLFIETDKPILGICFGCQFLNVIEGGGLIQHIADVTKSLDHRETSHRVMIEPGTRLSAILGGEAVVASSHHQAIRSLAPGLQPSLRTGSSRRSRWTASRSAWACNGILSECEPRLQRAPCLPRSPRLLLGMERALSKDERHIVIHGLGGHL